ncbi:MAG: hypothetical protein IIB94_01260 [Candidatus Marinimicrobia bacterium]|nr:hypothetical protein [Candidatus Neomarinimicrobiota bacterium]
MLLGVHLTLLLGPTLAVPAPPFITDALEKVEVKHSDEGRSGFQMTFKMGRSGPADALDYPLLSTPLLGTGIRIVLIVTFSSLPKVLIDGIIDHQQHSPSGEPGTSTMTVSGEDISSKMDIEEKSEEHPAQDETIIALKLIAKYAKYGMIPMVIPPLAIDPPLPIDRIPVQQETDLKYLKTMAKRHGYVFYITPGPLPMTNTAYWGPPIRVGLPQKALTIDMGPDTNVIGSVNFKYDAKSSLRVKGVVQDRTTNVQMPVQTFASLRFPLSAFPDWLVNASSLKEKQYRHSGTNVMQAYARAQAEMDASTDNVVEGTGVLDAICYGDLLEPRKVVGLRGAGYSYDGFYYVKSVKHEIKREEYKQHFTITREGLGALSPVVPI